MTNPYDKNYLRWKDWVGAKEFGRLEKYERACFGAQIKKTLLKDIGKVLEIGFGNGSFLTYTREKGWDITGVEVSEPLLQVAKEKGFRALPITELSGVNGSFDLIVAYDVFEHIPQSELPAFIMLLKSKLRVGGALIARFPNGDSPLGMPFQNGDVTHVTVLGSNKVRYLAGVSGLEIIYLGAEAIPLFSKSLALFFYVLVTAPLKFLVEYFTRFVFFPKKKFCFASPNLVVVLARHD